MIYARIHAHPCAHYARVVERQPTNTFSEHLHKMDLIQVVMYTQPNFVTKFCSSKQLRLTNKLKVLDILEGLMKAFSEMFPLLGNSLSSVKKWTYNSHTSQFLTSVNLQQLMMFQSASISPCPCCPLYSMLVATLHASHTRMLSSVFGDTLSWLSQQFILLRMLNSKLQ